MIKDPVLRQLIDILSSTCVELFAKYGVRLEQAASGGSTVEVPACGVIGFTADKLRGTLVLGATEPAFQEMSLGSQDATSWIAELANQLLGAFRNRMAAYNLDLRMSTPIALSGRHLRLSNSDELFPLRFCSAQASILLWVDLEGEPGIELPSNPQVSQPVAQDLLLF